MAATVIVRRILATPVRPASEAWAIVVDLLAPTAGSDARRELEAVAGVASVLISDEALRDSPAVIWGSGPRVRLYCLYDDAAISADAKNENSLPAPPTDGDWHLSLPCPTDDLAWVQRALGQKSTRVTARDMADPTPGEAAAADESQHAAMAINEEVFLRP